MLKWWDADMCCWKNTHSHAERNNKLNSSYGSDRSIGQFYSREIGRLSLRRYFHLVHLVNASSFGRIVPTTFLHSFSFSRGLLIFFFLIPFSHSNTGHYSTIRRGEIRWTYFRSESRISVFKPFKFNNKEQTVLIWCIRSYLSCHSLRFTSYRLIPWIFFCRFASIGFGWAAFFSSSAELILPFLICMCGRQHCKAFSVKR